MKTCLMRKKKSWARSKIQKMNLQWIRKIMDLTTGMK
jgi:hypothetical protein